MVTSCGAEPCCGGPAWWVSADYLFGWIQKSQLPPLVTTSPAGTAQAVAGVLGSPTTSVLAGGPVNDSMVPGFRVQGGYWFGHQQCIGVEGGFSMLGSQSTIFPFSSDGTTILARPFFSAIDSTAGSFLVGFPGSSSGSLVVRATTDNFYEWHVDLVERWYPCDWLRFDTMVGYRGYRYQDKVRIEQQLLPTNPNFAAGTVVTGIDDFSAKDVFQGCDFGVRTQFVFGKLSLDLLSKVAFGDLHQGSNVGGSQTVTVPGVAPVTTVGGVLALSSNIGLTTHDEFALLPELGATLNWQIGSSLRLRVGYSALFLDDIVRAANQINLTVNPQLFTPGGAALGGPALPSSNLNRTGIWIQALSVGAEITF
jgi:hypothetical protein